ncbi:MAG: transcription elongation factor GreA [Candidatus Uhrbacteria bacterium]
MTNNDAIYLTPAGLEKLREDLHQLKYARRKEIAEKIEHAKELGDLSENAEYQEAKDEQAFIEGRIIELENLLNSATVVAPPSETKRVSIGSTACLGSDNGERTFTIVGANEADPGRGMISNDSPLGQALLGKSVGEEVEVKVPKGTTVTYKVLSIA